MLNKKTPILGVMKFHTEKKLCFSKQQYFPVLFYGEQPMRCRF